MVQNGAPNCAFHRALPKWKKNGTELLNLSPIPFLGYLFSKCDFKRMKQSYLEDALRKELFSYYFSFCRALTK